MFGCTIDFIISFGKRNTRIVWQVIAPFANAYFLGIRKNSQSEHDN
jgi:hypothetical protein